MAVQGPLMMGDGFSGHELVSVEDLDQAWRTKPDYHVISLSSEDAPIEISIITDNVQSAPALPSTDIGDYLLPVFDSEVPSLQNFKILLLFPGLNGQGFSLPIDHLQSYVLVMMKDPPNKPLHYGWCEMLYCLRT